MENVRHCGFDDLLKGEPSLEVRQAIDAYLHTFATPLENFGCIKCGKMQGGIAGAFQYGIAHGEGICSSCGWPGRANHYIKDVDGGEIARTHIILQYHPEFVNVGVAE